MVEAKGRTCVPKLCRHVCPICLRETSLEQDIIFVMMCLVMFWVLPELKNIVVGSEGVGDKEKTCVP